MTTPDSFSQSRLTLVWLISCLAFTFAWTGPQQAQAPQPTSGAACSVTGVVQSGSQALPGVTVVALNADGTEAGSTSTEPTGAYTLRLPGPGPYDVRASLPAFAPLTLPATCAARVGLYADARVSCRCPEAVAWHAGAAGVRQRESSGAAAPAGRQAGAGRGRGGFQQLDVVASANAGAETTAVEDRAESLRAELQLPPGFSSDAPTETVATAGAQGQSNDAVLFGGRGGGRGEFGEGEGFGRGGAGGEGGFGGSRAGSAPAAPAVAAAAGRAVRSAVPAGSAACAAAAGCKATPTTRSAARCSTRRRIPLNGRPREEPDYVQQRYGASLGGPLSIPGLFNGGTRTSFFFNYAGNHSRTPVDAYSTVPTPAERAGDFSANSSIVIDPDTGEPFPGNRVPASRVDPAARSLLAYIPLPNVLDTTQNFHYVTANSSKSNDVNLRVTHVFGTQPQRGAGGGRGRGGFAPGGQGRGGPGGPGGPFGGRAGRGGPLPTRSVLNASLGFRQSSNESSSTFPTIGGSAETKGLNVPVSWMLTKGRYINTLNASYNRNSSRSANLYAYTTDVAGIAGIDGVSTDPFDWGIPGLSFTSIADLRDRTPSSRVDQRFQISNTTVRPFGRHSLRFGGEFRYLRLDSLSNSNPRGSFVFTGLYTSALTSSGAVPGTGLDLADFLLGHAQQASVQYGPGDIKMRGREWNLFIQDDWRARGNLTINYGLRYEYVSPYYEANNHLVNLDVNSDFTAAVPGRSGRDGAVHRRDSDEPRRTRPQQLFATPRPGLAGGPGHDRPRRLRHQLQPRRLRRDRAAARGAAAIRGHVDEPRHGHRSAAARRPLRRGRQLDDDQLVRHRSDLRSRRRADLERRRPAGLPPQPDRQRRLHRHVWHQPRHAARPEPRSRRRPAHRRRPVVPVAVVRRPLAAALVEPSCQEAVGARHLVRRRLHLVARLRQRLVVRKRRRHRGAERPGSRCRMGPIELRAPPLVQRRLHHRAAVGTGPAVAQSQPVVVAAFRRLELVGQRRGAVRQPVHGARHRQLPRRRFGRQRHAARRLQRRRHLSERSDDAALFQYRRVFDPRGGVVRHGASAT